MPPDWTVASRITKQRPTWGRAHYVNLITGESLCGLFHDRYGWLVWHTYLPPDYKICMFCQLEVDKPKKSEEGVESVTYQRPNRPNDDLGEDGHVPEVRRDPGAVGP